MTKSSRGLLLLGLLAVASACDHYRPALFADRAIVTLAHDNQPIPVPKIRSFDERELVSDIYLRRPLFDVVHPVDFSTGGDVNALDEVPFSSWYEPSVAPKATPGGGTQESDEGAPEFPLTVLDEDPVTNERALVVRDAHGARYEILGDPIEHLGMLTGAQVLGGHLLRGLGLHAPMSFIVNVPDGLLVGGNPATNERLRAFIARGCAREGDGRRFSATRWPRGIDVGSAGDFSVRKDDPNDTVEPNERRTLRAMKVFANWMAWSEFGIRHTRDVYVGAPNSGHVVHYFVGTSSAFGTQDLQDKVIVDEGVAGGFWYNLVTFGLSPLKVSPARTSRYPSLGYFPSTLDPEAFVVSPAYSPFARFTAPDEYWAAKKILDMGDHALIAGIAAAQYPAAAGEALLDTLRARRRILVSHALSAVSPLDVAATIGHSIWLRDRAISAAYAKVSETSYEIEVLDALGNPLAPATRLNAHGALLTIDLPVELSGRVVLHVVVFRNGIEAPRACDVHLETNATTSRLIGLQH